MKVVRVPVPKQLLCRPISVRESRSGYLSFVQTVFCDHMHMLALREKNDTPACNGVYKVLHGFALFCFLFLLSPAFCFMILRRCSDKSTALTGLRREP